MDGCYETKLLILSFISIVVGILSEHNVDVQNQSSLKGRIVHGIEVPLEQYSFAIQFINSGALCGGVILNSLIVLTAAHCFELNNDTENMMVLVGARKFFGDEGFLHSVAHFVIHEDYNKDKDIAFENDIALILLEQNIQLNKKASRALIADNDEWMNPEEKNFEVIGWGKDKYKGSITRNLMKTHMQFVPLDTCAVMNNLTLSEDMFCLYGDGVRDSCSGDSGGGILWHHLLVGLTSHGFDCAAKLKPSMYTNVYYFRDWISTNMEDLMDKHCHIRKEY